MRRARLMKLLRWCALTSVRCRQLSVLLCAWLYVYVKRRTMLATTCILTVSSVALLVQWGVVCVNMQSWWHVHRVCLEYASKAVEGSMCAPLCLYNGIESLSCQRYYMGKEAVFAASWNNVEVIFKSPKRNGMSEPEALYWVDDNSLVHYPSDAEFQNMIKNNIKIKFNMTASDATVKNMSRFHYYHPNHTGDRFTEMRNLWFLLQDNEYLAILLYEKYDIFPKLIGSCGPFYTMQRMKTITHFSHLLSMDHSREEWLRRVRIALMILDLLHALEHAPPEPLHICDVKMNHFGMSDSFDKIKYLDLDAVHPRSVADKIAADGSDCLDHRDCDFFDCRSNCDPATKTCSNPIANNNLQIVCEKIFLGWSVSGRVLVPGLLLGPYTPRTLVHILQRCANPGDAHGVPRAPASADIRNKIYNVLTSLKAAQ